eukprot:TRINITY_DN11489_c0_g1_i5.p1 TRINITY_DN11489_c0_g1~~TRINITY_DN11489_c0_g1_i5.p1  ORF type:complete len:490 (+),score=70.41 TRINITY_DN11489_c0_g1_i5:220-1689(+)
MLNQILELALEAFDMTITVAATIALAIASESEGGRTATNEDGLNTKELYEWFQRYQVNLQGDWKGAIRYTLSRTEAFYQKNRGSQRWSIEDRAALPRRAKVVLNAYDTLRKLHPTAPKPVIIRHIIKHPHWTPEYGPELVFHASASTNNASFESLAGSSVQARHTVQVTSPSATLALTAAFHPGAYRSNPSLAERQATLMTYQSQLRRLELEEALLRERTTQLQAELQHQRSLAQLQQQRQYQTQIHLLQQQVVAGATPARLPPHNNYPFPHVSAQLQWQQQQALYSSRASLAMLTSQGGVSFDPGLASMPLSQGALQSMGFLAIPPVSMNTSTFAVTTEMDPILPPLTTLDGQSQRRVNNKSSVLRNALQEASMQDRLKEPKMAVSAKRSAVQWAQVADPVAMNSGESATKRSFTIQAVESDGSSHPDSNNSASKPATATDSKSKPSQDSFSQGTLAQDGGSSSVSSRDDNNGHAGSSSNASVPEADS